MVKASDYESGDSRFESWVGHQMQEPVDRYTFWTPRGCCAGMKVSRGGGARHGRFAAGFSAQKLVLFCNEMVPFIIVQAVEVTDGIRRAGGRRRGGRAKNDCSEGTTRLGR